MIHTIKSTIDRAGRIVIPRDMRKALRLDDRGEIEIAFCDDHVEIRPAERAYDLIEKNGIIVAEPVSAYGDDRPLSHADVEAVRRQIHDSRSAVANSPGDEDRS